MGINLRRADPIDFATCVGSVREYHNWDVDEIADFPYPVNRYEWDPANSGESGITSYDNFYQELNDLNLEVCATIMLGSKGVSNGVPNAIGPPSFIVEDDDYCGDLNVLADDPLDPLGYRWYGDYLTQFANRYGAGGSLNPAADKHDGDPANPTTRGLVHFVENWNEQDHFWDDAGTIEPEEYAMMVSIAYDGFGGPDAPDMDGQNGCGPNPPTYDLGVREMMPFVMGGTSNIDKPYLECMLDWFMANRSGVVDPTTGQEIPVIPFDVFNFHHYSNDIGDYNLGAGISPEESQLFDKLREIDLLRNWA